MRMGSRAKHISKVCSQLIIGTPLLPGRPARALALASRGKDEVPEGLKLGYSRGRTCTIIDRVQVQSTAAGKLQRGLAQAGRGYRCFVRGSRQALSPAPAPARVLTTYVHDDAGDGGGNARGWTRGV